MSARAFDAAVVAAAKGLVARGVQPGDRVGIMSRTRYEWTLLDFAIWAAGAVPIPLYETSSAEQVHWILTDSGVSLLFVETAEHAGGRRRACARRRPRCGTCSSSTTAPSTRWPPRAPA